MGSGISLSPMTGEYSTEGAGNPGMAVTSKRGGRNDPEEVRVYEEVLRALKGKGTAPEAT